MSEWSANKTGNDSATWTSLVEMFGNRLTRDYGDSVPETWRNVINALKPYELERGMKRLLEQGSGSPPTLPQFVKACLASEEHGGATRNPSPQRALPSPEYTESVWAHAQRCLLAYLWTHRTSTALLPDLIAAKNKLVADYRVILSEDDSLSGADIRDALFKAWDKVCQQPLDKAAA